MKRGNIEKWAGINNCKNLLYFAQLVNELLFDYSIPSNRIATLNSHYLCLDAMNTINSIDYHGVPEGTIKPIMEELYNSLSKDVIFSFNNESPLKYFVKYQNGSYRYSTNTNELNYSESKKVIFALMKKFFSEKWYYNELEAKLSELIIANQETNQIYLFNITKSYLTELVNGGYSTNYIYEHLKRCFFNKDKVISLPEQINDFFKAFDFVKHTFTVVFILSEQQQKLISCYDDITCTDIFRARTNTQKEKLFLNKDTEEKFLIFEINDYDPYSASVNRKKTLGHNIAFYRMCDHNYEFSTHDIKCGVYDEDNYFTYIEKELSAVQRSKTLSKNQINEFMETVTEALNSVANRNNMNEYFAVINAATFHSLSLDSISEQNQLLDLWAIFETILDISNKHTSDRIQQICIYLVPILKRKYIYSLFFQLANDIRNYSQTEYNKIIKSSVEEFDIVKRICEFVTLDEYEEGRNKFFTLCNDFPLLNQRIAYYHDMLSSPYEVYKFVENHSERVKWQIMRIYRNRNLIVHNGNSMSYLALLIENLHAYVDDFLSYVILSLSKGHDLNSMCQELFAKECEWLAIMGNKKTVMTTDIIETILLQ